MTAAAATTPREERTWAGLTVAGIAVAVLGAVAYVAGWQLGWVELMVIAAGCAVALLVAVPFVVSRSRISLRRTIAPDRVMAGEPAAARLVARNEHRLPSRSMTVEDMIGGRSRLLEVPHLGAHETHEQTYDLPTGRRGILQVGPAVITRSDPLGLLRRHVSHASTETLWIHPRWHLLKALPAGFAKDLEGPTSDDSPVGDIAFHAVRPYQTGDDPRHVHWMSSARAGQVMVRHYVDNRRPHLSIVVDANPATYLADEFETAVSAVASLLVSMQHYELPAAGRVGRQWIAGKVQPADRTRVLDRLTTVEPGTDERTVVTVADTLRVETATSVLVLVTTGRALAETMACVAVARRQARVIVIDVATPDDALQRAIPGARLVRAASVDELRLAWNRMVG